MTRNSDIDGKDLSECDHTLEIPISENGDILYWRCQCGQRREKAKSPTETQDSRNRDDG